MSAPPRDAEPEGQAATATARAASSEPPAEPAPSTFPPTARLFAVGDSLWGESTRSLSPLIDFLRGLGVETQHTHGEEPRHLDDTEISALLRDGLIRRAVSLHVVAALQAGHSIDLTGSRMAPPLQQETLRRAEEVMQRVGGLDAVRELGVRAKSWGQAILGCTWQTDRGLSDMSLPLGEAEQGRLRWMSVWDRRDYKVTAVYNDMSVNYREPAIYRLSPGRPELEWDRFYGGASRGGLASVEIDGTRCVRLTTPTGFSLLQDIVKYVADLLNASGGGSSLMARAGGVVLTLPSWEDGALAHGTEARDKVQAQYAAFARNHVMLLAEGEKAQALTYSLTGIENGIYAFALLLCAALGVPMTQLLGTSPGAFESGEEQARLWEQGVAATQAWLVPALRYVWDRCLREVLGPGVPLPAYQIVHAPLRPAKRGDEIAELRAAAELAIRLIDAGLLSPEAAKAALSSRGPLRFDFGA